MNHSRSPWLVGSPRTALGTAPGLQPVLSQHECAGISHPRYMGPAWPLLSCLLLEPWVCPGVAAKGPRVTPVLTQSWRKGREVLSLPGPPATAPCGPRLQLPPDPGPPPPLRTHCSCLTQIQGPGPAQAPTSLQDPPSSPGPGPPSRAPDEVPGAAATQPWEHEL